MSSTTASEALPALLDVLSRLGLTEYTSVLTENGFRSWETVLDITEDDLTALQFKLGHRRTLQREIATYRGVPNSESLMDEDNPPNEPTSLSASALESLSRHTSSSAPAREKRRYRRHPRPDPHAPKKPKTAYVNFADQLRTDPEVANLSFVDIAKEVGRRWQHLPAEQKRIWESHAARAMQEFEAQMDEYKRTDAWRKYQSYLNDFKIQQTPSSSASVKRPGVSRNTSGESGDSSRKNYSRGSLSRASSTDSPPSVPSSANTEAEVCHNALTLAFSELVSLRGEILNQSIQPYDEHHLPSEQLTRRAMYAFVRGTGSLLYMWTYAQCDVILDRIYRPTQPVDAMTLAECFTVAAMGAHYDLDCFPDRIRQTLYASGTLHFHEQTARVDYLRTMRLLLSMSFYALLEKHMSARYLIAAGLQIARWKCPGQQSRGDTVSESWRRIFRSLVFMDCWLAYTLGYTSEITPEDVAIACMPYAPDTTSMEEMIHTQTSKIGLVAAEIAKTLASPELMTRDNVDTLKRKLETWRMEVPLMLQLDTLTSANPPQDMTLYQRRAILMIHIMYLGAVMLLYRQLLVATAETQLTDGAAWSLDLTMEDAKVYRDHCSIAAQQVARILSLISFDGTLTKRCWIIIYWAFSSSIILLFSSTTKLLEGTVDGVDANLAYTKSCMDILEACRAFEPIAARYLDTLWPLYDALRNIHQRMLGRAKTSIFSLLLQPEDAQLLSPPIPVSKTEMGPISEKLSELLTDPFGRRGSVGGGSGGAGRRVLSADGSCLVFWWR